MSTSNIVKLNYKTLGGSLWENNGVKKERGSGIIAALG